MDRDELLDAIRAAHTPLEAALDSIDDDALLAEAPGMPGWTRKDILAHVEAWNRHSTAIVEGVRTGVDPYPDTGEPWDLDAFNARVLADNRDRDAADVRRAEAVSFAELLAAIGATDDETLFGPPTVPWLDEALAEAIAADTTGHYPEHAPHLA